MAVRERRDLYSHAIIDCSDMTLTEYDVDGTRTYNIKEILKSWDGIPNTEIEIRQSMPMPANER